jgi:hypothetical protein
MTTLKKTEYTAQYARMVIRNTVGSRVETSMTAAEISSYESPERSERHCKWGPDAKKHPNMPDTISRNQRKRPHVVPRVPFFTIGDVQRRQCFDGMRQSSLVRVIHSARTKWHAILTPPSVSHFMIVTAADQSIDCFSLREPLDHKIIQHPTLSPSSNFSNAALVAASKTSSTPSPVSDEHSRYLLAPIS